jgi:hypothetical protein
MTDEKMALPPRTPEQEHTEQAFLRAGHRPENRSCDHKHYDFKKHGRYCTCGSIMVDFGD